MKISFCVPCMNRIEHLQQTLPHNINLIKKYNAELSLVNYDSKDNMHEYVTTNFKNEINNKILNYIKVENREYFCSKKSKNIAHKYSSGDILVSLDADNFLTDNVIEQIIKDFSVNPNYLFHCGYNEGFIVMSRENFFKLGGYNEKMRDWGYEDTDLVQRAFYLLGGFNFKYLDEGLVTRIEHSDELRFSNLESKNITKDECLSYNDKIHRFCMESKIINPNEYYNIDWGKL